MLVAAAVERRRGSSAAGWIAALPVGFVLAILAVTLDQGTSNAAVLALSAGAHVVAQIAFAIAVAHTVLRHRLVTAMLTGVAAYVGTSLITMTLPPAVMVLAALPLLALAPRAMPATGAIPAARRSATSTVVSCAAGATIVLAAIVVSRLLGPVAGGVVTAFPTMSAALAVLVGMRGRHAATVAALTGLVRSLPCYVVLAVTVSVLSPAIGALSIPVALLASLATAYLTWTQVSRSRPVTQLTSVA